MSTDDHDIRAVFASLRHDEPSRREVEEAVSRARRGRFAARVRPLFAVCAASAAAAVALAAVALQPAGEDTTRHGTPVAAGPFAVASARAAKQAERPGYRYTRVRIRFDEPDLDLGECRFPPVPAPRTRANRRAQAAAEAAMEQELLRCSKLRGRSVREFVNEQWVDKDLHGRVKAGPHRLISGRGAPRTLDDGRDEPFMYGDVLLADQDGNAAVDLARLPTDPAALQARLADLVTKGGRHRMSSAQREFEVVWAALDLLTYPQVSSALRSATFAVLARIERFRNAGMAADERGRRGQQMHYEAPYNDLGPGPGKVRITVVFDTEQAELLSYTKRTSTRTGEQSRTTLIEQAADVPDTRTRP